MARRNLQAVGEGREQNHLPRGWLRERFRAYPYGTADDLILLALLPLLAFALISAVIVSVKPPFAPRTDIVGYPIVAGFSIDRYFFDYVAVVVGVPCVVGVLYLVH